MLLYLTQYLAQFESGFNVFSYLTMCAILGALTALGLSLLLACSGGADRGPANTLQRGLQVGPETLDPQRSRSAEAAEILRDLGEGLERLDKLHGRLLPVLGQLV